jgi:hypothetical protein
LKTTTDERAIDHIEIGMVDKTVNALLLMQKKVPEHKRFWD